MKATWCAGLVSLLWLAASGSALAANGVVGPGNCDEGGFDDVLATVDGSGGGTITFNCGTATIPFTFYKQVANAVTIDGGGTITFDGQNASAFFQVYASANVTLRRLTLRRGAFSAAHAIENFGKLRLDRVLVRDSVSGGATVQNYGTLRIKDSTFSGNANTATDFGGDGGAIAHDGTSLVVEASTFVGNSAGRHGAAIFSKAPLTIENATFTANNAAGGGAAVYQTGSGSSSIDHATIAGNTAVFGGGIYKEGSASATLTISRSIIADNTGGNCDGVLLTGGYNLWSGSTGCGFTGPGDGSGDPQLGALAANGGATQTRMPGSGSVAINRIPSGQCSLHADQRGGGRPSGAGCDSGSVEVGAVLDVIFQDDFD